MAAEKPTVMVLKVDLQCPCCYKKVKKTLCKFPQIRDQVYDEKANTVTITVICCSPEKIRDKLRYKGGKVIKGIDIKEPPKPKEAEKPKEAPKPKEAEKAPKPKEADKPKSNGKGDKPPAEKPPAEKPPEKSKEAPKAEPPKGPESAPKAPAPGPKAPQPVPKGPEPAPKAPEPAPKAPEPAPVILAPAPVQGYPPVYPTGYYYGPSYESYAGGPIYDGYGRPVPPPPSYDNRGYGYGYGNGYGQSYGISRGCHLNRCDYFSEENPQACSIM